MTLIRDHRSNAETFSLRSSLYLNLFQTLLVSATQMVIFKMKTLNFETQWLSELFTQVKTRSTLFLLSPLYILFIFVSYVTLVAPGISYVKVWLNDVMGLIDIANRFHLGQMPYQDFHMLYGPLVGLVPGWGLDLGLPAGAIFGFQGTMVAALILLTAMISLPRRLTPVASILVFCFVGLLIVVPLGETQSYDFVSWGTFYNRQGWAALILILLFYVKPLHILPHDKWFDSIALAILVLFEIYTKATFAVVALGFLVANAAISRYNRSVSLITLLFIAIVVVMLEVNFHFHLAYFQDVIWGINLAKGDGLDLWRMIRVVTDNAAIIVVTIGATLAYCGQRRCFPFDILYVIGAILATIILTLSIGAVRWGGFFLLIAVLIVIGELSRRAESNAQGNLIGPVRPFWHRYPLYFTCLLFCAAFLATETINRLLVWQDFTSKVTNASPLAEMPPRLAGILVPKENGKKPQQENNLGDELNASTYMKTIVDGTNLLLSLEQHDKSVVSFDMVNPFPYAAEMKPPIIGYPLFWLTTTNKQKTALLPTPERFLGHLEYVMVPRLPYDRKQHKNMMEFYGPYLKENLTLVRKSDYWELWGASSQD